MVDKRALVVLAGFQDNAVEDVVASSLRELGGLDVRCCASLPEAKALFAENQSFRALVVFSGAGDPGKTAACKSTFTNCAVLGIAENGEIPGLPEADTFQRPFRLGALAGRLEWHLRRLERLGGLPAEIQLGTKVLDLQKDTLIWSDTGREVRLTEKERDILVALYLGGKDGIDRKALLQNVWRYAETVETHTLETHIYRLRQKVEDDPARPSLVCTSDGGYILGIFKG